MRSFWVCALAILCFVTTSAGAAEIPTGASKKKGLAGWGKGQREKVGAEYINVEDWGNMVTLFERIARHAHEFQPGFVELKKRLVKRFRKLAKYL